LKNKKVDVFLGHSVYHCKKNTRKAHIYMPRRMSSGIGVQIQITPKIFGKLHFPRYVYDKILTKIPSVFHRYESNVVKCLISRCWKNPVKIPGSWSWWRWWWRWCAM